MALALTLPPVHLGPELDELRAEVRGFLDAQRRAGAFEPACDAWLRGYDPAFSRALAQRGWVGMTWPARYGGSDRSDLERYVVTEELLAAGAPVAAHWGADRQVGPSILRHGTEEQRQRFLPAMARAEVLVAGAMSEPDAGSDLASLRTAATPVEGGWLLSGRKVWTSHAHRADEIVVLCRTSPPGERRHEGISQLIVAASSPGITVRPIRVLTGEHHFNEVLFDDVFVPGDRLLGRPGDGWAQITAELVLERCGPDRFLSTFPLVRAFADAVGASADPSAAWAPLGRAVASLWALRRLSISVAVAVAGGRQPGTTAAGADGTGRSPEVVAALVKDLGTRLEQDLVEVVRLAAPHDPPAELTRLLAEGVLSSPGFTLRGGTNEILRGIVAKALGAR
jgi:acyl-CoA dehydrogenase